MLFFTDAIVVVSIFQCFSFPRCLLRSQGHLFGAGFNRMKSFTAVLGVMGEASPGICAVRCIREGNIVEKYVYSPLPDGFLDVSFPVLLERSV